MIWTQNKHFCGPWQSRTFCFCISACMGLGLKPSLSAAWKYFCKFWRNPNNISDRSTRVSCWCLCKDFVQVNLKSVAVHQEYKKSLSAVIRSNWLVHLYVTLESNSNIGDSESQFLEIAPRKVKYSHLVHYYIEETFVNCYRKLYYSSIFRSSQGTLIL